MKPMSGFLIGCVLLASCGGNGNNSEVDHYEADGAQALVTVSAKRLRTGSPPPPPPPPPPQSAPSQDPIPNEDGAAQFIAYSYSLGLEFPQTAVEPTMQAHVAACEAAGPRVCIVTNSSINNQSDDYTNAYLSLRAIPSWIETFQAGLDAEVDAANGAITQRNKQSVDLTRQILDTDARLSAKITLKGRLEDLLATREGDLGELLQVERELARVTGEIESITSNLKALRLRVSMSDMTVNYTTKRSLVAGGRANPLASAFGDFFYNMAEAFAAVITFFAVGLPWMILIAIFLFIWLRGIWPWVRRKRNKT